MTENPTTDIKKLTIAQLAEAAWLDWGTDRIHYAARPYLSAMMSIDSLSDKYGADDGSSIVVYFLSNARGWRGEVAREIKKELNRRLKAGTLESN